MNVPIYLVVASGGRYEDAWSNNLAAFIDKEKAEARIVELTAEQVKRNETVRLCSELSDVVEKELGPMVIERSIDLPRWPSGLGKDQITQQMKNDRLVAVMKNKKIAEHNFEVSSARFEIHKAREALLLTSLGYAPDHELFEEAYHRTEEISYSLDEVELL